MAPDSSRQRYYHRHRVEGVDVYLNHNLMLIADRLTVRLGGVWRWRWLKVEGVAPLASCAI